MRVQGDEPRRGQLSQFAGPANVEKVSRRVGPGDLAMAMKGEHFVVIVDRVGTDLDHRQARAAALADQVFENKVLGDGVAARHGGVAHFNRAGFRVGWRTSAVASSAWRPLDRDVPRKTTSGPRVPPRGGVQHTGQRREAHGNAAPVQKQARRQLGRDENTRRPQKGRAVHAAGRPARFARHIRSQNWK